MHLFFSRRRRGRCRRGRTSPGLRSGGRKTRSVEAESILRQATFFPAGKAAAERFVSKSKSDGKISEMQEKNDEIWMKYIYGNFEYPCKIPGFHILCTTQAIYEKYKFITCVCCFIPSRQNQLTTKTTRRRIQS